MTDAEILASLGAVVWEPSCEAPDDPGAVVRHAAPISPEERLARLQRDPAAIAARERRIAIEQGRVARLGKEASMSAMTDDTRRTAAARLREIAQEFVDHYLTPTGCSNCGGVPHSALCFVRRFMDALLPLKPLTPEDVAWATAAVTGNLSTMAAGQFDNCRSGEKVQVEAKPAGGAGAPQADRIIAGWRSAAKAIDDAPGPPDMWDVGRALAMGALMAELVATQETEIARLRTALEEARAELYDKRARLEWLGEQALSDLWIQELDEVLTANQRDRVLNAVWAIRRNDPTLWQDIKDAHAERRAALASPEAR